MKTTTPMTGTHMIHLDPLVRNIGIVAHVDAGKTTVTERLLYYSGKIHDPGETHHGRSTTDFDPREIAHGITISSAATSFSWNGHRINLIDTPGHIDFNIEVKRALRVLDGATVVFDAVAGVEPQTETNWRLADEFGVPRIAFVNKMDRRGADFDRVSDMMRKHLGAHVVPIQIPMGSENEFAGVIDLIDMKAIRWLDEEGWQIVREKIPTEYRESALIARRALIEAVAEANDELMNLYLDGKEIGNEQLWRNLRKLTIENQVVPMLCGTALRNRGIQPLLDAVVRCLPSPADIDPPDGVELEDFCGFVFKTAAHGNYGELAMTRIYGGEIRQGDKVINSKTEKRERISRIVEIQADRFTELQSAKAGDIVGLIGLKHTDTGQTLCAENHLVELEQLQIPEPVTSVSMESLNREQGEKLGEALHRIAREDPTLRITQNAETGQTMLSGMGELHLEMVREKLESMVKAEVRFGRPEVAYRETIRQVAEVVHLRRKQSGGPGQFARVAIRFEPLPRGEGFEFVNEIKGGAIPSEYIPSVKRGIETKSMNGPIRGCPLIDFKATLFDGETHPNDSSQLAFELAGAEALDLAMESAAPVLLEPVMAVTVNCPEEALGDVIGDLSRRRGIVTDQICRDHLRIVKAEVPLANLFGYIGDLRSLSSGRAGFSMEFDHYGIALEA